jgi:hypothetical protein
MKVSASLCLVLVATCIPSYALHTRSNSVHTQQGMIVRVDKEGPAEAFSGGDNPSDAPLRSESYDYNVTLRVACGTYVGRYESASDYLPSVISANNKVKVKLERHFVDVDSGSQEIHMPIVHRNVEHGTNCDSKRQ